MRRILTLRGLSARTPPTASLSRSTATPSAIAIVQSPSPSAPFSSQSVPPASPARRHNPTAPSLHRPTLGRFYSSDKQDAAVAGREPALAPETESQLDTSVADEAVDTYDLSRGELGVPISEGPYSVPAPRIEAARAEEVIDPGYVPATSADDLETVGGVTNWWNRRDNWDSAGDFVSFRPRQKIADPALIELSVRRAVVEAFALRAVGRDEDLVAVWPTSASKADLQGLVAYDVRATENGEVTLGGDASAVAERLRWRDDEVVPAGGDESVPFHQALTSEEASALNQLSDPSWKSISLADPRIRFAVTKRVFQLTGQLTPDHQLSSIHTVQALLHVLKKPPKPATLTKELQTRHQELTELPNVVVAPKRVTRGDKEKALGRFKLMQEEFKKRDLPLDGHGYVRKGKEVSRLRGGT
ncbi:ribosomal subunit 39S-domain-containing protein [Xylaria palmicola]|nr:ribosomal subunit 39S-domain-containing protein [Xylaria palmicola]